MSNTEVEDTEAEPDERVEDGGVRAIYPGNVPIYPWNDPSNGTRLVEHEGEPSPTGEEAVAALMEQSDATAAGELDPVTGLPFKGEDDQVHASTQKSIGETQRPVGQDVS